MWKIEYPSDFGKRMILHYLFFNSKMFSASTGRFKKLISRVYCKAGIWNYLAVVESFIPSIVLYAFLIGVITLRNTTESNLRIREIQDSSIIGLISALMCERETLLKCVRRSLNR